MTPSELRTPRLVLRRWRESDLAPFAQLNADPEVMRWFPSPLDRAASDDLVSRIESHHDEHGFGLWAIDVVGRGASGFAGFVGLAVPRFDPPFATAGPCVEVGWRLARGWWGQGIATEAAAEVLRHGFEGLGLTEIVSFTVPPNLASQAVMQRVGMRYDGVFDHPSAPPGAWWAPHVLYRRFARDHAATAEASGRTSP